MVIRRAYWLISALVLMAVWVSDDDGGRVAAQAGDDERTDGAGIARLVPQAGRLEVRAGAQPCVPGGGLCAAD
jgi:hypothetical protein